MIPDYCDFVTGMSLQDEKLFMPFAAKAHYRFDTELDGIIGRSRTDSLLAQADKETATYSKRLASRTDDLFSFPSPEDELRE